jgi:8-oxo-dGTP diphosphatase
MPIIHSRAIVIYDRKILLMFRRKKGQEFFAIPGGHLEAGEDIGQAGIRELREETNITAVTEKTLYHLIYDNDEEQYFILCKYVSGVPSIKGSEEEARSGPDNFYQPMWVDLDELSRLVVYPVEVKLWLLEDIKMGFSGSAREVKLNAW